MDEVIPKSILTEFETSGNYSIEECLGHGAYGPVFLVYDKKTGQKLAAKLVMKSTNGERDLWPNLCHPNLLPFIRTDELSEFCIVHLMPYVGCDLFHQLHEKVPSFHEDSQCFARKKSYVKDILKGLEYMHSRKICHLDLKVENILICYKTDTAIIGDFSTLSSADFCNTTFGLNLFVLPPEVVKRKENISYDIFAAEMWTFGVLMLQMFTLKFNFRDNQVEDIYEKDILPKIMSSTFHKETRQNFFHLHKNVCLSYEDATQYFSFISQFLVLNPQDRCSTSKALEHPFLTNFDVYFDRRKSIRLKPKTREKEICSLFKRMSLFESNTTKRSIFTIEKRRLIAPKNTQRCFTEIHKSKRKTSSDLNSSDSQRRYSWPTISEIQDSELMKRISEMVKKTKSSEKLQNRRGKKLKIIEEDSYSNISMSGDCLHLKRSRFAKSIRKYKLRFRFRKQREILPNFYHSFETKPEIQFSFNPAASTSGSVMKFTGTNKPGVVKKRPKNNKRWSLSRMWKAPNGNQFYDSFADDVILLPPK